LKFNRDENGGTINFNLKTEQEISQHFVNFYLYRTKQGKILLH